MTVIVLNWPVRPSVYNSIENHSESWRVLGWVGWYEPVRKSRPTLHSHCFRCKNVKEKEWAKKVTSFIGHTITCLLPEFWSWRIDLLGTDHVSWPRPKYFPNGNFIVFLSYRFVCWIFSRSLYTFVLKYYYWYFALYVYRKWKLWNRD